MVLAKTLGYVAMHGACAPILIATFGVRDSLCQSVNAFLKASVTLVYSNYPALLVL